MHVPEPDVVARLARHLHVGRDLVSGEWRIGIGNTPPAMPLLFPDREALAGETSALALVLRAESDTTRHGRDADACELRLENEPGPRLAVRVQESGVERLACWMQAQDFFRTHLIGPTPALAPAPSGLPLPVPLPAGGWASLSDDGRLLIVLRPGRARMSVLTAVFSEDGTLARAKISASSSLADALWLFGRRLEPWLGLRHSPLTPETLIRLFAALRRLDDAVAAESARRDDPRIEADAAPARARPEDVAGETISHQAGTILREGAMGRVPPLAQLSDSERVHLALAPGARTALTLQRVLDRLPVAAVLRLFILTRILADLALEIEGQEDAFDAAERGAQEAARVLMRRGALPASEIDRPLFDPS